MLISFVNNFIFIVRYVLTWIKIINNKNNVFVLFQLYFKSTINTRTINMGYSNAVTDSITY